MKGMVTKVKLLPFEMNPHIRTYLNYAYAFGVIEGNLGGEIIPRLVLSLIHIFSLKPSDAPA